MFRGCIQAALAHADTACLLLVSSRLVRGNPIDLQQAVAAAHRRGVAAIIDGAAQDMRIGELIATGADLVLVSAHKYLASPTAGLVIGRRQLVEAVRAQHKGIGRGMKPTKEAIVGALAAIEERQRLDLPEWRQAQDQKVSAFVASANGLNGISARSEVDPAGMPFSRVCLRVDEERARLDARAIVTCPQIRQTVDLGDGASPGRWANCSSRSCNSAKARSGPFCSGSPSCWIRQFAGSIWVTTNPGTREMHHGVAGAIVVAADGNVLSRERHDLAPHFYFAVVIGHDRHPIAWLATVRIVGIGERLRLRAPSARRCAAPRSGDNSLREPCPMA